MILTNALLSIGFALVSNFTKVVPVPVDAVPARIEDLKEYFVGSTLWPVDLSLVHRRGTAFGIQHGTVCGFMSPDAFEFAQFDREHISRYYGTPTLSSNEVFDLAERTVRHLAKRTLLPGPQSPLFSGISIGETWPGDPLAGLQSHVQRMLASSQGPELPYYTVMWMNPKRDTCAATVEIDARNGEIVAVHLLDERFYDLAFAWKMRNEVYTPDLPKAPNPANPASGKARTRVLPCPSTNQVLGAIGNWLWLCQGLGVNPGSATNLNTVDWERSCLYTNPWISATAEEAQIMFTNGTRFNAFGDTASTYFLAGACYVDSWQARTPEQWFVFEGKITSRWDELAKRLEHNLVEKLGIPKELLAPYTRRLENDDPPVLGAKSLKRVLVEWTNGAPQRVEYENGAARVWENHLGFEAEFDLETGEVKSLRFRDPILIEALGRAQPNRKR